MSYHRLAAVHHRAKADVYADAGLDRKARGHRARAAWHASFGADLPPERNVPKILPPFDRAEFQRQFPLPDFSGPPAYDRAEFRRQFPLRSFSPPPPLRMPDFSR